MSKNGFTLIELMVGLVIGLLCILMLLMLFKQISQVGITAAQDAEYDAQLELGLLSTQKLVQNAGYGTGKNANGTINPNIVIATYNSQPAVYWRLVSSALGATPIVFQCQGLSESITAEGSRYIHRLQLLKATNCGTESLTTYAWSTDQTVASLRNNQFIPIFTYSLTIPINGCTPYGIGDKKGDLQLGVTASKQYLTGIAASVSRAICLVNIK